MGRMTSPRLRYGPTLVLGLAGAIAVTVGVTKPWVTATAHQSGLPTIDVSVTGASLAPLAGALGVVVLAAFGAVIATRGWVRRALGVLIVLAAGVVLVTAIHPPGATSAVEDALSAKGWSTGPYDTGASAWRWIALGGALVSMAAGVAISVYGSRWATMGREYDAPTPAGDGTADATAGSSSGTPDDEDLTEAELWRELDHGRDPTHRDGA